MAKKKTSSIDYLSGYVPASFNPAVTTAQIKQIPPYPDKGVSFSGYSKRLIAENAYDLKKQDEIDVSDNNASTISDQTAYTIPTGRTVYITDIILTCDFGAGNRNIEVLDGSARLALRVRVPMNTLIHLKLQVPLPFTKSIVWNMDVSDTQTYINFVGWVEDN